MGIDSFMRICYYSSTGPFMILEPQNQDIGLSYVIEDRRGTDFEAKRVSRVLNGQIGFGRPGRV